MRTLRFGCFVSAFLVLAACSSAAPQGDRVDAATSSFASGETTAADMLHSLRFPDGWKAIPAECGTGYLCFFSPSVYTGVNSQVDHETFAVHPTSPDSCDRAYAEARAKIDGDDAVKPFTLFGQDVGYQWNGYAGAGVMPGDPYSTRFACVSHPTVGFDILVSSSIADEKTIDYLDGQFIPFWLSQFVTE